MDHTTGEGETTAAGGTLRSQMHLHTGAEGAEPEGSTTRSRRSQYASRVAGGVGELSERMTSLLDDRMNAFGPIRRYPLIAVGAAFALGLTLASTRRASTNRHWMLERTRRQLRTLLMGTATAAIVSELHRLAESDERIRTLLGAYLGEGNIDLDDEDEEDDYADFDELDDDDEEDELPRRR